MERPDEPIVFVDLGAYDGRSTRRLLEAGFNVSHSWMFEPNPHIRVQEPPCPHTVINSAAWLYDGVVPLYIGHKTHKNRGQGSTILREKTSGELDLDNPMLVDCLDFPEWLKRRDSPNMMVKMNIEGAEYALLQSLYRSGAMMVPKIWIISFHTEKVGRTEIADNSHRADLAKSGFMATDWTVFPNTEAWFR